MTVQNPPPVRPSFGKRLGLAFVKFLKFLLKLLFIILILAGIAAAIYFGGPVLIDEYLLKDVHANRNQIQEISAEVEQSNSIFGDRLSDFQERLESLEIQGDSDKQTIADLQSKLATAEEQLTEQAVTLDSVSSLQALLTEYEATLAEFEAQIAAQAEALAAVQTEVEAVATDLETNQTDLISLQADLETADTLVTLRHDLELLKALELITRARVSIGDENIGLAGDDLELARELLANLSVEVPPHQAEFLAAVILRLELAQENLTTLPDLASEDLEVAWQLLIRGLPDEADADETEETATTEEEAEATPTPTPEP